MAGIALPVKIQTCYCLTLKNESSGSPDGWRDNELVNSLQMSVLKDIVYHSAAISFVSCIILAINVIFASSRLFLSLIFTSYGKNNTPRNPFN